MATAFDGANEDALHICYGCEQDSIEIVSKTDLRNGRYKLHLQCRNCYRSAFPIVEADEVKILEAAIYQRQKKANDAGELFCEVDQILEAAMLTIMEESQWRHAAFEEFYLRREERKGLWEL